MPKNIYRMSIPEMVKRGWTLFNDEKIPGRLGIRSVIPDWNELPWAQQTYYRAKYRFDENGVLEIGVSEINSASQKTIRHFHCDLFTEEKYVTPDGAMSGSNDRIREILEQNRVDLAYRGYDDTALVHTGPDGSIIYTNEVGWGPPMYWPEEKYYYELDDHHTCFWETGPYWVSEMPCWACPECNGF